MMTDIRNDSDELPGRTSVPVPTAATERPQERADDRKPVPALLKPEAAFFALPKPTAEGWPEWCPLPPKGWAAPPELQVIFIRCRASHTRTPQKGEKYCVLYELSVPEMRVAVQRAHGDPNRVQEEMTKQMIRLVGNESDASLHAADWSGLAGPGTIGLFWDEIGAKYREQLTRLYMQIHQFSQEEQVDFFDNCIEVRTTG